ncbi:hypothetical protein [Halobellus sp. EA9]|uniref:hypothetical protein n=1 Tax=Halobellus sp. EA9 TaxID=3421647 RepID=UPI003EC122C3
MTRDHSGDVSDGQSEDTASRRAYLLGLVSAAFAFGGVKLVLDGGAFASEPQSREVSLDVAEDQSNAVVGVAVSSPVGRNPKDPLVTLENNTLSSATATVSLDDPADGTLYGPEGDTGASVTFPLPFGESESVEIRSAVDDGEKIAFTIAVRSSEFTFEAQRETTAVKRAVRITALDQFVSNPDQNSWSVGGLRIRDNDADDDLREVEYEIADSDGTVRATRTDTATGGEYRVDSLAIHPDDSAYDVRSGHPYTLHVRALDADGNYAQISRTASSSDDSVSGDSSTAVSSE